MVETKYYVVKNNKKELEWIARDIETKEVVKEFPDIEEGLKYVNKNENTELYSRATKNVFDFIRR